MSIISIGGQGQSDLTEDTVHQLAARLSVDITNANDAKDYLVLLRSLESVLKHVKDAPDYIHPELTPQSVVGGSREYWKPRDGDNPMNAWSFQCNLKSSNPTSELLKDITIAIKDNISVGGLPTTLGTFAEVLSHDGSFPVSPIDSSVVARILSAGGVIRGSSTCENHCASPLSFTSASGPVHHPLLHGYTSGGSSSGSCALVTAHALKRQGLNKQWGDTVEFAIGSDQAGSVRIPASFTGIYGLKPTFGLVPYTGAGSMSPMIDHLGPIAPSLEGIATLLKVMAGYDGLDPRMTPESPLLNQVKDYPQILADFRARLRNSSTQERKPLRVGFLTESFVVAGLSASVRDTVRLAAKSFEAAGAEVMEISIPLHSEGPIIWTASTRPSMSESLCQGKTGGHLSYLPPHLRPQFPPTQQTFEMQSKSNPALVNIILSGEFAHSHFGSWVEGKAHHKVFELRSAYDRALEVVDVLVTPCAPKLSMPHPNPESGILEKLSSSIGVTSNTCPFNVTGHPALSVPCGSAANPEHPDIKFPIGMQVIGRRWEDETVLMAAALFEVGRKLLGA
ncbi:amidase signature domain-containing protein [Annulohypoxylon maeteangense]|uniref:amidase signature domain-containing protein n=1 Tax=Annulohypoxylon maeteangense TaxID=1927788 RepID=UPI0020079FC5|nr:amidase signature domain-containing protein [Annulohypoxylon maeteangense]KAI0882877.1 amidase signature domain-containing protein [Annulohypoxylon maeteangense]